MATREIIEIPDSKSGDINELRDKKIALAKDAAAQSDLPQQLEYLIKNGQTGEFMNVLDSYINEKIRVALGNLAYSYAKESTMARVLGIDANKDLGSASLSSLASLLGGLSPLSNTVKITVMGSSDEQRDANVVYTGGTPAIRFTVNMGYSALKNGPTTMGYWGLVEFLSYGCGIQLFYDNLSAGQNRSYIRNLWNGATPSAWRQI